MRTRNLGAEASFAADVDACRGALRGGSKTFFAASLILPGRVCRPATALYAFCRAVDDAIDHSAEPKRALDDVRRRLRRIYDGEPLDGAADRCFAETVKRFAIPRALPEALVEGFEWDTERRRYADLGALCDYAARVAGTVGVMMAAIMGIRDRTAFARAAELGLAMQLTNIARDVGEDAAMGRIYLPLDWMRDAGLDPDAFLARPVADARLASVVRRLLIEAEAIYARGRSGISALPAGCRPAIAAAAALYAEIGREVARREYDSVRTRAVVSPARKAGALLRAAASDAADMRLRNAAPMDAIAFLVDAAASVPAARVETRIAWWRIEARAARMVELCEILQRREQLGREGG